MDRQIVTGALRLPTYSRDDDAQNFEEEMDQLSEGFSSQKSYNLDNEVLG